MTKSPSANSAAAGEPLEAALAAHDIKNLLGAVIGHADLQLHALSKGGKEGMNAKDLRASLKAMRLSASHALTLCEEMLALADGRPPRLSPINLASLAREAVEIFDALAGDAVQVEAHGAQSLSVLGHRSDLQRTLLNLMWNAFEAMDGQERKKIMVRWGTADSGSYVEVVDAGPGLPTGHLADLTRPFQSNKGAGGQVRGLGLHAAARIMRRHGGRLLGQNRQQGSGAVLRMQFGLAPELDFDASPAQQGGRRSAVEGESTSSL